MEMDDVGLLELTELRDVGTGIGNIDLEQVLTLEMEPTKDHPSLPEEAPVVHGRLGQTGHREGIGVLVAHQHLGLHTIIDEGHHQTAGSHCSPTRSLARIDYQYSHTAKVVKTE